MPEAMFTYDKLSRVSYPNSKPEDLRTLELYS